MNLYELQVKPKGKQRFRKHRTSTDINEIMVLKAYFDRIGIESRVNKTEILKGAEL